MLLSQHQDRIQAATQSALLTACLLTVGHSDSVPPPRALRFAERRRMLWGDASPPRAELAVGLCTLNSANPPPPRLICWKCLSANDKAEWCTCRPMRRLTPSTCIATSRSSCAAAGGRTSRCACPRPPPLPATPAAARQGARIGSPPRARRWRSCGSPSPPW
jgi:hypothetical protein